MKRKVRFIQHTPGGIYAVADDGTWWRIIDPLSTNWVQLPNLPDAPDEEPREERPIARLKVKS